MKRTLVIGVDFGSDSARALIVDAQNGRTISEATAFYPRWNQGKYQDAAKAMFRQHPLDYLEALTACVRGALQKAGEGAAKLVAAISIDATGSTPCPVDQNGTPLALLEEFSENPGAMFHLWKDHTAIREAEEITRAFSHNLDGIDYTRHQGPYASEWFWAKILHTVRLQPEIRQAAWSWVEHSDWIPALLVGNTVPDKMYRCACAAGHKAYWHSDWNGLPSKNVLGGLDPYLMQVVDTYGEGPLPSTHRLGTLAAQWADKLGLDTEVIVGGSSFDAHAGAVGAGVNRTTMVLNLGTSAVDMFAQEKGASTENRSMAYAGGQAENSILPGMIGLEAGQAAFGDVFAWFKRILLAPTFSILDETKLLSEDQRAALQSELEEKMFAQLQRDAEKVAPADIPIALDWFNGRRYPYVNEHAKSAIEGLDMGTTAPMLYRALVTATAFGQKNILDALKKEGVTFDTIVAVGGIAQKSTFLMQILADVLEKEIRVSRTKQACALGAAIYAAVAAGLYASIEEAQQVLCEDILQTYEPNFEHAADYKKLFHRYRRLSAFMDLKMKE